MRESTISKSDRKSSQKITYNKFLLNDLMAGLGAKGFVKIKTLKDLVNYRFIRSLRLKKDEMVLDLGCNAGELLNKIVATYRIKGYGLDISDKTIEVAKRFNPYGNQYIVGDGENLPYRDGYFDVVVSTDVLEHVPRPDKVISEIARVLKAGGRFYIYCISRRNFLTAGWFMQKFHYKNAWGDVGDHQKDLLVDPKILTKIPTLKVEKISYFDSFFMHLFDEFVIRPFLALVASSRPRQKVFDKKFKIKKASYPVRFSRSAAIYLFFLKTFYYIALILDSPWRLFKLSNAILVSGQKK